MPFLMGFALEHEIVTFAWIDNASVQFALTIYATKGCIQQAATLNVPDQPTK